MLISNTLQATACELQGLLPTGLAEDLHDAVWVHGEIARLRRCILAPNQGLGEALRMVGVIEPVTPLYTEALVVGQAVSALDKENLVVFDVVGELTPHTAIGTDRIDFFIWRGQADIAGGHEGAGGTGLNTLTTGHAGRCPHGVVHIKDDLCMLTPEGKTNHIVDLLIATCPKTASALYTGIEIDRNGRVGVVGHHLGARCKARLAQTEFLGPEVHLVVASVVGLWHVRQKQFKHHLLRLLCAITIGRDLHVVGWMATAGRRKDSLAIDLNHASTAVACRLQAVFVTEVGDGHAVSLGHIQDGFVGEAFDLFAIDAKGHLGGGKVHGLDLGDCVHRPAPLPVPNSCGKYLTTQSNGLGAA